MHKYLTINQSINQSINPSIHQSINKESQNFLYPTKARQTCKLWENQKPRNVYSD